MPTVTIETGHVNEDLGMLISSINPKPPFLHGVGIHAKEYVEGVDYDSGDDIVFDIPGTDEIKFACFTNSAGTIITYTEANASHGGKTLTLAGVTASKVKAFFIHNT